MDWHNLADPPHGAVHIQHSLCGFLSVWICRKHTLMLRLVHFGWFLMSVKEKKKKVQSKSRRQYFMNLDHLHPSHLTFPVELIPNVSCGSLMSIGRISLAKRKVLGGRVRVSLGPPSFPAHCEGHFPLLDCPINQPPAGSGSFLVPVTTSDCLGCNTSRASSSMQLIIALTWQKRSQQMPMLVSNEKRYHHQIFHFRCMNSAALKRLAVSHIFRVLAH